MMFIYNVTISYSVVIMVRTALGFLSKPNDVVLSALCFVIMLCTIQGVGQTNDQGMCRLTVWQSLRDLGR